MNLLDIDYKEKMLCVCAKDVFDFIFRIDLQEEVCLPVYQSAPDKNEGCEIRYAELVKDFVREHADAEKEEEQRLALRLDRVRAALQQRGRYEVIVDATSAARFGCKILTFLPEENGRYATLYGMDFSSIADYYNERLISLKEENYRDSLTNTFNRNFYEFKLRDRRISGSVAVIDIDDFKLCNDTYGHDIGDLALIETARSILCNMDGKDTLVRIGGDEFLLVLPDCSADQMACVLEKIRTEIHAVQHGGFGDFRLSVSIGAVTVKNEAIADAVYRADRLMYLAKKQKNALMTERQLAEEASGLAEKTVRQKILIVDDSDFNRKLLTELLGNSFDIQEAASGEECMEVLAQYRTQISVVLLDIIMPVMDGFAVLKAMGELRLLEDIPVVMISADDTGSNIRRAFEMGATDYIHRPFDAKVVERRIRNTVKLYAKQRRMLKVLTEQTREKEKNGRIMVDILSNAVGYINGESVEHIQNLKKITAMLLERLILKTDRYGLAWRDCELISTAAMLHDIGKVGVAPAILNKPDRLAPEEYECMKTHTLIGERILISGELSEFQNEPLLKTAIRICRWHHERYDGGGYPDGISGENIPIAAQVVGLADAYDALVSERSYKKAYTPTDAIRMIRSGECGSFHPLLVECLSEIIEKLTHDIYK